MRDGTDRAFEQWPVRNEALHARVRRWLEVGRLAWRHGCNHSKLGAIGLSIP
jgi:hypothetical protein